MWFWLRRAYLNLRGFLAAVLGAIGFIISKVFGG